MPKSTHGEHFKWRAFKMLIGALDIGTRGTCSDVLWSEYKNDIIVTKHFILLKILIKFCTSQEKVPMKIFHKLVLHQGAFLFFLGSDMLLNSNYNLFYRNRNLYFSF